MKNAFMKKNILLLVLSLLGFCVENILLLFEHLLNFNNVYIHNFLLLSLLIIICAYIYANFRNVNFKNNKRKVEELNYKKLIIAVVLVILMLFYKIYNHGITIINIAVEYSFTNFIFTCILKTLYIFLLLDIIIISQWLFDNFFNINFAFGGIFAGILRLIYYLILSGNINIALKGFVLCILYGLLYLLLNRKTILTLIFILLIFFI